MSKKSFFLLSSILMLSLGDSASGPAHKYVPLPTFVWVTNLENNRRTALWVNDHGPFVKGRIIDLSAGAAKRLDFYKKGTAWVLVETVKLEG